MAHICHEFALGPVGRFGVVFGLEKRGFRCHPGNELSDTLTYRCNGSKGLLRERLAGKHTEKPDHHTVHDQRLADKSGYFLLASPLLVGDDGVSQNIVRNVRHPSLSDSADIQREPTAVLAGLRFTTGFELKNLR